MTWKAFLIDPKAFKTGQKWEFFGSFDTERVTNILNRYYL